MASNITNEHIITALKNANVELPQQITQLTLKLTLHEPPLIECSYIPTQVIEDFQYTHKPTTMIYKDGCSLRVNSDTIEMWKQKGWSTEQDFQYTPKPGAICDGHE